MQKVPTPGKARCEDVAEFLGLPLERTLKSIVLAVDAPADEDRPGASAAPAAPATIVMLMLRGDHELNEVKAGKVPGLSGFRFASAEEIVATFGSLPLPLAGYGHRSMATRNARALAPFTRPGCRRPLRSRPGHPWSRPGP